MEETVDTREKIKASRVLFDLDNLDPEALIRERKIQFPRDFRAAEELGLEEVTRLRKKMLTEPAKFIGRVKKENVKKIRKRIRKLLLKWKAPLKNKYDFSYFQTSLAEFWIKSKFNVIIKSKRSFLNIKIKEHHDLKKEFEKTRQILEEYNSKRTKASSLAIKYGFPIAKTRKIISDARLGKVKIVEKLQNFDKSNQLIARISAFLESKELKFKSLKKLCDQFNSKNQELKVSLSTFRRHVLNLGFSFKGFHCFPKRIPNVKEKRIYFLDELSKIMANPKKILFSFDVTSLNQYGFKKKAWSRVGTKNWVASEKFRYPSVHILMCITASRIVSFMLVNGRLTSKIVLYFFSKTFKHFRSNVLKGDRDLVLVMDNSPLHKTRDMIAYFARSNIKVLFTVPHHPILNPIEHIFLILKSTFKREPTMIK